MARLLQVFGFLSVLFLGATLAFQALAIGCIFFFIVVLCPTTANSAALRRVAWATSVRAGCSPARAGSGNSAPAQCQIFAARARQRCCARFRWFSAGLYLRRLV